MQLALRNAARQRQSFQQQWGFAEDELKIAAYTVLYYWQVQSVGKTKNANSKISEIRSFSTSTPSPPEIRWISWSTLTPTLGETFIIKAQLYSPLTTGFYDIKISIDNGELQAMTGSSIDFSFSFTPTEIGEHQFKFNILDAKDSTVFSDYSQSIFVKPKPVKPVVLPKTTGYSKIANDGSLLPDDANLGVKPEDWACTKDNKTGLIWEVKTAFGGLRDWRYSYSWYKPEGDNGGNAGYQNNGVKDYCTFPSDEFSGGSECNTYAFTNAVNKQGLCGAKDWRLPNNEELKGLVYCSDDKYNTLAEGSYGSICKSNEAQPDANITSPTINSFYTSPTINSFYFPNTQNFFWFWSSSPSADYSNGAWVVDFLFGKSGYSDKSGYYYVRLVRG